ncbi:MAG TPA: flagellar hook-associated family protein [Bosea sp. (in: a-proteobacteria)]|jgi:flagellar hook-associated protein 3 FlgL|uniref:flagellar hook-associated family protein n=1 Tax=Bosea sp. (in: a-proteobacteria) TaxID=1871050 RepID=UPI002E0E1224|nr:flagellar hook-associated family protein [Bosea sp. (in: a-proteobacteria)]
MKTSFISNYSLSGTLRNAVAKARDSLADATKESATLRHADVGLTLGGSTGKTVGLRDQYNRLNGIVDTNGLVSSRLEVTQKALDGMRETAEKFLATLISIRDGDKGADVLKSEAKNNLQAMTASLNASASGQFIFAGINTQDRPVTDYFSTPAATNKAAIDAAFLGHFGFAQNAPAAASITQADMTTFLQTVLPAEFADPAWGTNWSSAQNQNMTSRISLSEVVEVSTNANTQAMRDLAQAYTMAFELGDNLNSNAFRAVVDASIDSINKAILGITATQAQLGSTEERVKVSSERLTIQRDITAKQIKAFEDVDPYEANVRVTDLTTQLDTAYALTVRIQQLNILQYMR